ncbi:MAG: sulfur carrier protein ThiS adenylyltransferase ThiF [Proteobacteria bacterium]|nr:sulfur carrier protein ThiS adenylyltransferase ThiF [Pseudomonadota bacterium]
MKIKVNEKELFFPEGMSVFEVKDLIKPYADIVIYNGFPVKDNVLLKDGDEVTLIKRGEMPSKEELEHLLIARHTPKIYEKLKKGVVGIAGVGGLGSNVAISLARVGVGKLIIADFDVVEPSNLNRQQYFIDQLGKEKVFALKENISRINPFTEVVAHNILLTKDNIPQIFAGATVIVEAFDRADMKAMIINTVFENMEGVFVVSASGLAGYGPNNDIKTRKFSKRLFIVGDLVSEAKPGRGLMAPRVSIAAGHQANQVIRILLNEPDEEDEL